MTGRYRRPQLSRARRRALFQRRLMWSGIAAAVVICLIVAVVLITGHRQTDQPVSAPAPTAAPTAASMEIDVDLEPVEYVDDDVEAVDLEDDDSGISDSESADATARPATTPAPASDSERALTRPTPTAEGFIPVFTNAETEEKIVAITVDDCYQPENLQKIVQAAKDVDGKLTIFPIGGNVVKKEQAAILKDAWESGFELENHTLTHNALYAISDEKLAEEVFKEQMAISYILDLEYQCHFLRPMGGDARNDQRLQMYAQQMGYYGIAHWSCSGSDSSNSKISKALKPGAIYLFHTTDADTEKLLKFIPWVVEQGYQLVTLNEMFGYPENETKELTMAAKDYPVPPLEPYTRVYTPLKKTTYSWYAYELQEKLIELGYLEGKADGIYGDSCVKAVTAYQKANGLEETGIADPELLETLLGA